jgi:DNA polymerase-3 subunit alpha
MYLNCHTAFSFKYGTLQVADLFNEARRCGVHKLVLTEINNTASYIEMLRLCGEHAPLKENRTAFGREAFSLEIAAGIEFRKQNELCYITIARNNHGFEELNRFLSHLNLQNKSLPDRAPDFDNVYVVYPFYKKIQPDRLREHEFIGVRRQDLNHLARFEPYHQFSSKFVVWHPVTFASKTDFNTHRLLRAIDTNTLLSKLPEHHQACPDEIMMPESELEAIFSSFPELIVNARRLMDDCRLEFILGTDKNKKFFTASEQGDWELIVCF